jgi:hypothetical protein
MLHFAVDSQIGTDATAQRVGPLKPLPALSHRAIHQQTQHDTNKHALAGQLLLCQVGLRKGSRAALAGRAGLPGWGCFIPSTSR